MASTKNKLVNLFSDSTLIRYIITGGSAYVIEMGCLYVLRNILNISSVRSVALSFWVGFFTSFILQKHITYKNYHKETTAIARQLGAFTLLAGWNYLFSLAFVAALDSVLSVFVSRTFAIACITLWNFALYKKVFKQQTPVLG